MAPPLGRAGRVGRARRLRAMNAGVVAGLLLLGAYAYLVEFRGGARQDREKAAAGRLLSLPVDTVDGLTIEQPGMTVALRRDRADWRIEMPIRAAADGAVVSRLLDDLAAAQIDRTVPAGEHDLSSYGLDRPVTVTVAAGRRSERIEIGRANPTDEFVYVRRSGRPDAPGPILLAGRRARNVAEKSLYDLRDKAILDFTPADVVSVDFADHGRRVRLVRRPAAEGEPRGGWELRAAISARADRAVVERMLDLASTLRAERFVAEAPTHLERYGLAQPWGEARLTLRNGHTDMLLFGKKMRDGALTRWFARRTRGGPVFTINENLPSDARRAASEWRERHVVDFERADAAEIRLIGPDRTVVCALREGKGAGDWRLAEYRGPVAEGMNLAAAARMPSAVPADRDRVEDLLGRLAGLQTSAFAGGRTPPDPQLGLSPPSFKVEVRDRQAHVLAAVAFGAMKRALRYASGPHLDGVFLVPAADADRFRPNADLLVAGQTPGR